jgi:hypothetical protein
MIWNLFLAVSVSIPLEGIKNKKCLLIIETGTSEWVFNGKAQD